MLNTTALNISQARFNTAFATETHLRHHGAGLCALLDALDDQSGFAAFCDLQAAFGKPVPDFTAVQIALCEIHRVLAEQTQSSLDRIGHERNLPASDMTRWHGARVSELLARFRNAD
ncbi:MAG: hypothetical protein ABJP13_00010 [Sulfitobacter sp.]